MDDFLSDSQTQTPAEIFLGSEGGLKDLLDVFGFNPCLGFSRTPRPVPSARAYVAEFEEEWRQRPGDLALTGRIDHLSDIRPLIRNLLSSVNAWTAGVVTGLAQEDVRTPHGFWSVVKLPALASNTFAPGHSRSATRAAHWPRHRNCRRARRCSRHRTER